MTRPCPLCQVSPDRIVWESDSVLALRDRHPVTEGHTLVVLKRHVQTYFDASAEEQAELWRAVRAIRAQLDEAHSPAGYNVGFDAGTAAGQTVMHVHVHVIPRRDGDMDDPRGGVRGVIPWRQSYSATSTPPRQRVVTGGREDPLLEQLAPALDGARTVDLAVAFVFDRGVELLHDRLVEVLRQPGGAIRIVTGDYQDVTEPDALRHLLSLPLLAGAEDERALVLRMYRSGSTRGETFHPKAWLVRGSGATVAWVGSSNMSRTALQTGREWNYQLVDKADVQQVRDAFEQLWVHPNTEPVDLEWVRAYEDRRRAPVRGGKPLDVSAAEDRPIDAPTPREGVQNEALLKLEQTRLHGNQAGLVVLATGLGKTFLSAFDSLTFDRVLFVAHREEILQQALETFRRVRPKSSLGLFYGKDKQPDADLLFASVQTLNSAGTLESFDPQRFDYIVMDEFHHAEASTYRRVIDHFRPKFLLGLTATPDRLDGANLLALCEGNLVYRADIPRGIADRQLSPFHYWGVGDSTAYERIPWRSYTNEKLSELVATEARAEHALATLRKHTTAPVRALGFCVTQSHADFMAGYFADHGVNCAAVYAGSSAKRVPTLEALARGDLEIVFCVDMFNEGVDIPAIDTVFMLRPTQSSIVWLQQLGRGLRYVEGKTLTVLDYIGNHSAFLRRPEILLRALDITLPSKHEPWDEGAYRAQLPPGVHVDFDLEAKDVLATLRKESKRAGTKAERWYREFCDVHDKRPTALEADKAGYRKQLSDKAGGWFAFVESDEGLTSDEVSVFERHRAHLEELEKLPRDKSDKLLVLAALLNHTRFPRPVDKTDLCERISARARRSAELMRDLTADGGDPKQVARLLEKDAFPRLARLGKGRVFENRATEFAAPGLEGAPREALVSMIRELVELHLERYLEARHKSVLQLPCILDDDGNEIDARFDVEEHNGQTSVIFHSRGGTKRSGTERNTEYRRGLTMLLERLFRRSHSIVRVEVDSEEVHNKGLTERQRTISIKGHAYPIALEFTSDRAALARAMGTGMKRVGQAPGTKGGNDTKRIRIFLQTKGAAGELWRELRGTPRRR